MRVVVTEERSDDFTYEALEIVIDDTYKFSVHNDDGSTEDSTLSRNFADCYDIPNMLRKAYEAGQRNEGLHIVYVNEGNDEF